MIRNAVAYSRKKNYYYCSEKRFPVSACTHGFTQQKPAMEACVPACHAQAGFSSSGDGSYASGLRNWNHAVASAGPACDGGPVAT